MKLFYAIVALLFCATSHAQYEKLHSKDKQERDAFLASVKLEDRHGHLITNLEEKRQILLKRLKASESAKASQRQVALNAVPMCSNGAFEEFTPGGTPTLSNFAFTSGDVWNPMECQTLEGTATAGIQQYNPNVTDIMATTVPANHLDPYIGDIGAFDQYALKINHRDSYTSVSKVQAKRFKTDNETQFKFNYKVVLQSIAESGHDNEQPFLKVRVIKASGAVVDEFCLIGTPTNCIFKQYGAMESDAIILYTPNWQSGVMDISSIANNEEFTVEFMASRCGLNGHFGYAYIDDICLLHSDENLQGSITLDPLYKTCPALPVNVCGKFTIPNSGGISATVQSITLELKNESNAVVYSTTQNSGFDLVNKTFCFPLVAANFPNVTAMGYNVSVKIQYGLVQTNCSGTNFNIATDDDANPGYDIWFLNCANCPVELHTANLFKCDTDHDGTEVFNLNQLNPLVIANTAGLTFSYFTTVADAVANTNPITAATAYTSGTRTIFVRAEQSATCFKIIACQVIVKNPTATISGILNVCAGSTTLTASPGASYLWSNGATSSSINPTATGSYSVNVTDSFGCQSTATVNIPSSGVAAQPNIALTHPTCFNDFGSITITSPASEVSFDNGATWGTSLSLGNLPVGSYVVIIKTVMNCISYPVTVTIAPYLSPRPDVSAVNPTYCGDVGSITVSTVAPFYSFDGGVTWVTQNTMSNLPSGIYQIRVKDANGCMSNYTSVDLFGQFLPMPDFTAFNPYCGNLGSITIDTPAAEYSFDGGNTWQTSNTLTGLVSGSYLIKIRNAQGCTSPHDYVYLTDLEYTYPDYAIDPPGCDHYGSVTITTPGDFYSFDGGATWTTNPVVDNLGAPQNFTVKVKKGSCESLTSWVNFYGNYLPLPVVNDYAPFICDVLNDGKQSVDLSDWNANLVASVTGLGFRYFRTLNGATGIDANSEIMNFNSYLLDGTNMEVFVRVTDANYCQNVCKLNFSLLPTPVIAMENEYPLCVGKHVIIRAGVFDRYLWSTGETTASIVITQDGDYWVTVFENHLTVNGLQECETTHNFHIFWSDKAIITNIETEDWTYDFNALHVFIDGIGDYEFSLDNHHFQDSPDFVDLPNGTYTVYVRDKFGCGTVDQIAYLLMHPRFFTPNGDGFNDYWQVKLSNTEPTMVIRIFDRHGKLLKQLSPMDKGWDGTYNEKPMPSSDYWFTVTRADGQEHFGHFSLKR
ncbi:T9SS type B sorting domain-containing protein [Flavobacterium sp.]|uniref:T9SS type B sorting domain-containing protein n=1 Tax=Flavobacterium sp. TaxID=239 RepID=UPI0011FA305C|nr:T9SS type B sorting domain-containing protein [Flavobacterium sp.]RZJ71235.1 MAG: T9SS type B sorting domain-containing protein [Flavobacterium sp.]